MSFYEIRHADEALPEPIFRTRQAANEYIADMRARVECASVVPIAGAVVEVLGPILEELTVVEVTD